MCGCGRRIYGAIAIGGGILALGVLGTPQTARAQDPGLGRRDNIGGLLDALDLFRSSPFSELEPFPPSEGEGTGEPIDDTAYGEQAVLLRIPEWQPWSFGASSSIEYQSNAALSSVTEVEDWVFRGSASGRGTFPLGDRGLFFSAGAQGQAYRYDALDLLDYDRVDVDAALLWAIPSEIRVLGGSILSVGASYYRMSDAGDFGDELFANTGATAALLRSLPLGRNHDLVLSASADVSLAASDEPPRRHEYAAIAALQSRWGPRWESSLVLGTTFYDYRGHDDWNFVIAAGVDYVPRDWLRIGIGTNFTYNQSDVDVFDYENFGVGVNLRASIQF